MSILALSVIASQCHLSHRERLWHPAKPKAPPLGELSPKVTERASPLPGELSPKVTERATHAENTPIRAGFIDILLIFW